MSLASHKCYGPKGVGALFCKQGSNLHPLLIGGGQERNLRAGTENVAGIAGFGLAVKLAQQSLKKTAIHLKTLENQLITGLTETCKNVVFNGDPDHHIPGIVSVSFPNMRSDKMMVYLDRKSMEVSAGSANSSWASRNMPMLGILVMLFILIHMKSFWYEMHFGTIGNDPWGHKDLYTMTVVAFQKWWYTAFYVISMVILGFHLRHGVESGFQTLGLKTRKYIGPIQTISQTIAILIPAAFAIIPIILHLQS